MALLAALLMQLLLRLKISLDKIFRLVQHLVASTAQVQNQVGRIVLGNKIGELAINEISMPAHMACRERRIDSRLIRLAE